MSIKLDRCSKCHKLEAFINASEKYVNSGYDLAIDANEFIKNCDCEEKEDESEEDGNQQ